jgi:integrase
MSTNNTALVQAAAQVTPDAQPDIDALAAVLPEGIAFTDDTWDVGVWGKSQARPGAFNLAFNRIEHAELRDATKVILLLRRMERSIGPERASSYLHAARALGELLGARPIARMTSRDAHQAAELLLDQSHTYLSTLATFIGALRRLYGVAVHYNAPKTAAARYGTKGTDAGRAEKRISDQLLKSMLQLFHRDDLPDDDRLFLAAIAFNLACGWRIGELLTLPRDCLVRDEGALYVRGYPSKGGNPAPKLVAPALAAMVEEAHETIVRITEPGRVIAKAWPFVDEPDWQSVRKDEEAILYFARKLLNRWGSEPENRLINPDAAWSQKYGWIDVLGAIAKHRNDRQAHLALGLDWGIFNDLKQQQRASREGRLWTRKPNRSVQGWMRDRRVCDKHTLFRLMGMATGQYRHSDAIVDLVTDALEHQKAGDVIPPPTYDHNLEVRHRRHRPVILTDNSGQPVLFVEDALFATPRHFVGSSATKTDDWQLVTVSHVAQWLAGTTSRASVFERYDIVDPETGETAKFTSHQVRHWLETQMHKGGLSNAQIATLMNRNDSSANSIYNQMSNTERRERVKEGIHDGMIGGVVAGVVKRADVTREEADDILAARLRQINVMPHGLCLKDLATEPCPHHMSCFATEGEDGGKGACGHLLVDTADPDQVASIRREHDNATAMVEMFEDDPDLDESPQVQHFQTIVETTKTILKDPEG